MKATEYYYRWLNNNRTAKQLMNRCDELRSPLSNIMDMYILKISQTAFKAGRRYEQLFRKKSPSVSTPRRGCRQEN